VAVGARARPGSAAGRLAAHPLPDIAHRSRGREIGIRNEVRVRNLDALDALAVELCFGRILEEVVPDDVTRDQAPRLGREALADLIRIAGSGAEGVREASQAADPELKRLDELFLLPAKRAGRIEALGLADELILLLGVPVQRADQRSLPDLRPRQRRAELGSDLLGLVGDLLGVLHVAGVAVLLCLAAAGRDPEDQPDDDEDGEADQPDETQDRC
jgi:hypothetical protein